MKQVWAIAKLAFWEGIRMRIVLVFLFVLVFALLRLPFAMRGDETLSGRLQTFLSYSLGALSLFMGLATVFLSCATLSNELRTRSIQMVVTKPVTRFQVLLGKWLGVNGLNLLMVLLGGLTIYAFAVFIKTRGVEGTFDRDARKLRDTVWTARIAAEPTKPDLDPEARKQIEEAEKQGAGFIEGKEVAIARKRAELLEQWRAIAPGDYRVYQFDNLTAPESPDTVFQLRFKARGAPLTQDETVPILWLVLDPATQEVRAELPTENRTGEEHQFLLGSGIFKDGTAYVGVLSPPPPNRTAIFFEGEGSLKVLYKVGSFEGNYAKALLLVLARLAFLSALGVFFSTFVSFPVGCFCVLSIYLFCIGVPWWLDSMGANLEAGQGNAKIDPYGVAGPVVRAILVPVLKIIVPDFVKYDGVGQLIEGEAITSSLLSTALTHTLLYGVFLLLAPGWLIFRSREVAQVQV